MRLAVVLDRWRRGRGGLEAYLDAVLPALARRHEVNLVAADADLEPPAGSIPIPVAPFPWLPRPWRDVACAWRLREGVAALRPDRILCVRPVPVPGAVLQPHGGSAPHLRRARGGAGRWSWKARMLEHLDGHALRDCGLVLAPSPKVAREFAERRPGVATAVLPPPLPAGVPEPARRQTAASPSVLFCGHDGRLKGAPAALAWFRALRPSFPDASLTLWSRSVAHLERVLGSRAGDLAREGVSLRGWDGGFRAALASAGLLLHPSRYDAFSLACLEAAAAGVPVLATAETGVAGLLGPPLLRAAGGQEPAQAAAALAAELLEHRRADPHRFAEAAAAVRAEYALERHVRRLEEILKGGA